MPLPINTILPPLQQATTPRPTQSAGDKAESGRKEDLQKACRNFESLFVNYMLQQMRQSIPQSGMFGGGQAEKIYTSMMDQEVAKEISMQRGMGLAPMLYHQMVSDISNETTKK